MTDLLSGIRNSESRAIIAEKILRNMSSEYEILQGLIFVLQEDGKKFIPVGKYAFTGEHDPPPFNEGEGLSGQVASDQKIKVLSRLPGSYSPVLSGLGKSDSAFLYIIPLLNNKKTYGVIEISTFREIDEKGMSNLNSLMKDEGNKLFNLLSGEDK